MLCGSGAVRLVRNDSENGVRRRGVPTERGSDRRRARGLRSARLQRRCRDAGGCGRFHRLAAERRRPSGSRGCSSSPYPLAPGGRPARRFLRDSILRAVACSATGLLARRFARDPQAGSGALEADQHLQIDEPGPTGCLTRTAVASEARGIGRSPRRWRSTGSRVRSRVRRTRRPGPGCRSTSDDSHRSVKMDQ